MPASVSTLGHCPQIGNWQKGFYPMKQFYIRYKHILPLLCYGIFYLAWFVHLENRKVSQYHIVHMAVDDYIPFCEVFVIPYFLWFAYVSAVIICLFFGDKNSYYKACAFLFTGMTIFLIISAVYPNGHLLRPAVFPRDNIFTRLLAFLYRTDTPTNLFPSIHVYNSLGAHFAIINSPHFLRKRKWIRSASFVLCLSIILSTVLIKQHSLFDVLTAFGLAFVMYAFVYSRQILVKQEKPAADFVAFH